MQTSTPLAWPCVHDHVHKAIREAYTFPNAVFLRVIVAEALEHLTSRLDLARDSDITCLSAQIPNSDTLSNRDSRIEIMSPRIY